MQNRERTQTPRATHCDGETHAGGDSPGTGNAPDHSIPNPQIDNPGAGNHPSTSDGDSGGHLIGTSDNTQSAASITIGGNPLESGDISPTVPFTHPDMPSTSGDDNEGGPRPRLGPYCTEAGSSRINEGNDTNPDDYGNGSEYICASSTECCPHGSHTEPGNPTGHDNPGANGDREQTQGILVK